MKNMGRSIGEAARIWTMWHQKEPRELVNASYPFEDYDVFRDGYADFILYASDKWEEDGDVYDYHHDFDSGPDVFMPDGVGDEAPMTRLLNTREVSARARIALPLLAAVKELGIIREGGKKHLMLFKRPPPLCCTKDKKGLVILTDTVGPIFIRGGRMVVTERGIHH